MVCLLCGMPKLGRNLSQRRQHKAALGQAGCGSDSSSPATIAIPHQQQIEIQRARTISDTVAAITPQFPLDGQQSTQQRQRLQFRLQSHDRIQEGGLIVVSHGFGFIEGGARRHPAEAAQTIDGCA